jgi:hypothetical protein
MQFNPCHSRDNTYDWTYSLHGNVNELQSTDTPEPLRNYVASFHYVDANLIHDVTTGRSVTGIHHLASKTLIEWYSKKQATVETAIDGLDFVAAQICIEEVINAQNTLRYLGVPIRDKSFMFGENKSYVDSSMQLNAKVHKRHTIISFHRVRMAIAADIVTFHFL